MPDQANKPFNIALACAIALGAVLVTLGGVGFWNLYEGGVTSGRGSGGEPLSSSCNVVDLHIYGNIVGTLSEIPMSDVISVGDGNGTLLTPKYTVASDVRYNLDQAAADPSIKGLLVDIDSSGGDAQAGQEIAQLIQKFGKPTVAVIHGMGASSAYLIASASGKIYAFENSEVGSIGVTSSYIGQYEKDKRDGLTYEQLSSGPFKDTFSPDKPLTSAERALIMRDVKIMRDTFVKSVAAYRRQPLEKIDALADGSTLLGKAALENGLIDEIGGRSDAVAFLEKQIGEPMSPCFQ